MKIFKYGHVATSSTNAFGIVYGAKKLGVDVVTDDTKPLFPIPKSISKKQFQVLFFTEEASLRMALVDSNSAYFQPQNVQSNLIDDKWEFVEWLKTNLELTQGVDHWSIQNFNKSNYPYLLKAKHSWVETSKLPRGWICKSPEDIESCLEKLHESGFNLNHFFLQKWLGDIDCRVVSVCGFHDYQDKSRKIYAVVERIASHTEGLSSSAAVETIEDEWQLNSRTDAILNAMHFTGPFELEYLISDNRVFVLELNPRFWMQHSIFLIKGNGVIKRYLKMDTEKDRLQQTIADVIWIDGMHLVHTVASFQFKFLNLVLRKLISREKKILIWPSLPLAIYIWVGIARKKFLSRF